MNKKKAARSAATHNGQRLNHDDIITNGSAQQGFVASILPHGEANAVKSRDLQKMIGLSDTRTLRLMIERERIAGAVILSSDAGYFLPSDNALEAAQELKRYIAVSDARCKTNRLAVKSAKSSLKRLDVALSGQEVIPDA